MLLCYSNVYAINNIKLTNGGNCSYYAYEKVREVYEIYLPNINGKEYDWLILKDLPINNYIGKISNTPIAKQGLCLLTKDYYKSIGSSKRDGHIFWYDKYVLKGNTYTFYGTESGTTWQPHSSFHTLNNCWYKPCVYNIKIKAKGVKYIYFKKCY